MKLFCKQVDLQRSKYALIASFQTVDVAIIFLGNRKYPKIGLIVIIYDISAIVDLSL